MLASKLELVLVQLLAKRLLEPASVREWGQESGLNSVKQWESKSAMRRVFESVTK